MSFNGFKREVDRRNQGYKIGINIYENGGNGDMVKVSQSDIDQAKKIGRSSSLYKVILRLIEDQLSKDDINVNIDNVDLESVTREALNELVNKKWKKSIATMVNNLLLYGFCPIFLTTDNGEIKINIPPIEFYDIYVFFDPEKKKR